MPERYPPPNRQDTLTGLPRALGVTPVRSSASTPAPKGRAAGRRAGASRPWAAPSPAAPPVRAAASRSGSDRADMPGRSSPCTSPQRISVWAVRTIRRKSSSRPTAARTARPAAASAGEAPTPCQASNAAPSRGSFQPCRRIPASSSPQFSAAFLVSNPDCEAVLPFGRTYRTRHLLPRFSPFAMMYFSLLCCGSEPAAPLPDDRLLGGPPR